MEQHADALAMLYQAILALLPHLTIGIWHRFVHFRAISDGTW